MTLLGRSATTSSRDLVGLVFSLQSLGVQLVPAPGVLGFLASKFGGLNIEASRPDGRCFHLVASNVWTRTRACHHKGQESS